MERTKAISLITQIYNKLSSKAFVSKTCSIHPACLPLYICLNCIKEEKNPFCEECFKNHNCNNKTKTQISQWVAKQQQYISNMINTLQRQSDAVKLSLQPSRMIIKTSHQQGLTINEINKQIISQITDKCGRVQKHIQTKYIKQVIQSSIKNRVDDFISAIKLSLNGITDVLSINEMVHNLQIATKNVQTQIKIQQKIANKNVAQIYKVQTKKIFDDVFNKIWQIEKENTENNLSQHQKQKQSINKISEAQTEKISKDIQNLKNKQINYISQINKLQQNLNKQLEKYKSKEVQCEEKNRKHKKQVQQLTQTVSQLKQKLQNLGSIQTQKIERESKIKILQAKCEEFQKQIDNLVRETVGDRVQPQKRYNIQEAAKTINQLSQQYHHLLLQTRGKDRKINELIAEINKLKIKMEMKEGN